jgi:hypothetical protein
MWVPTHDQLYSKKTIDKKNDALEQKMDQLRSDVRESVTAALNGLPAQLFAADVQERLMNTIVARLEESLRAQEERLRAQFLAEIERRVPSTPESNR